MRSLLSLGLLLAAALLAGPARAAPPASGCAPRITVQAMPVGWVERHDLSIREVTALNQGSTHALTRAGHGLGSTVVKYLVNARIDRDLIGCPSISIALGYETVTLYVARELQEEPCAFEHVRRHELNHLAIAQGWLQSATGRVRRLWVEQHDQLVAMNDARRLATVLEGSLAELRRVQAQQDAFDSPEEYRGNSFVCGGYIDALLRRLEGEGAI